MISPERKTIEGILKQSNLSFSVPKYQRSFDWGKSELQELIDDLKEIANSKDKDLFLGNFIFDVSNKNNYKIVDGQQRLTTISLIAIALREHAKKINESEFAGELQNMITMSSAWSKEKGNKIAVSENIRDLFEFMSDRKWDGKFPDKINGRSVKRQVNKVKPIYSFITNELFAYNKDDMIAFTRALMSAYVIVIQVENTEDVFSIFERTNARGLDLNIGDLLKNYIFSHGIEEFEEKWKEIIDNSENSLQRMLKYFWISRKGHILRSQLYKSLRNTGNDMGIEDFVNALYEFSLYYKMVFSANPDEVKDWLDEFGLDNLSKNEDDYKRIARVLQALKLFRVTQAYPLIFSIFKLFKDSKSTNFRNLFNVLDALEKYHFINNAISQRIGNEVEKFYAGKAALFFNSKDDFVKTMDTFISELRKKKALKDEFISNFIESVIYDPKNVGFINYLFDRINNFDTKGGQRVEIFTPEKDLKKRNYNVEHLLSQKKKSEYKKEEEKIMIDRIGNLLVIPRHSNSGFQDLAPSEKIKIMNSDVKHLGSLRYLIEFCEEYKDDFKDWNFEAIEKRSKRLAEEAFTKIWNF
jgi:uncharacterized protein with ParB-like and HNH nuclease domain